MTDVIVDSSAVQDLLDRLSRKMQDMSPVMADIADAIAQEVENNFLAGGRPAWNSLRDSTKKIREKKGKWPGQILVQSGQLKNSVHPFHGKDFAGTGTNKKYATTMQFGAKKGAFGTKTVTQQVKEHLRKSRGKNIRVSAHTRTREIQIPWGDIPKREFMKIPPESIAKFKDIIQEWLND